jgi:hypothetical protein
LDNERVRYRMWRRFSLGRMQVRGFSAPLAPKQESRRDGRFARRVVFSREGDISKRVIPESDVESETGSGKSGRAPLGGRAVGLTSAFRF